MKVKFYFDLLTKQDTVSVTQVNTELYGTDQNWQLAQRYYTAVQRLARALLPSLGGSTKWHPAKFGGSIKVKYAGQTGLGVCMVLATWIV